jgi:DNA-binding winged helix-turn-helix (wHTH) protein
MDEDLPQVKGDCMHAPELDARPEVVTGPSRMPPLTSRFVRFGLFEIDKQRQEVTKNGSRLKLQGKVYQLLLALVEKQGEVVTREELRLRLWPAETQVNCTPNVNTTVSKLRQALGDSSEKPLYIETVPGRGYCLVMEPEVADVPLASMTSSAALTPNIWITLGVIGLIFAGMLLGAGLTRLWIHLFAAGPSSPWP